MARPSGLPEILTTRTTDSSRAIESGEPTDWNLVKRLRRIAPQPKTPVTEVTPTVPPSLQIARTA
jgi:hypothetical protein